MGTFQPTRAPLQLEKLELWERFMDRKNRKGLYWDLKWKTRARGCRRGCNPQWLFLGSQTRGYYRFKRTIVKFAGRLDMPSFMSYKKLLVKYSMSDDYRFL